MEHDKELLTELENNLVAFGKYLEHIWGNNKQFEFSYRIELNDPKRIVGWNFKIGHYTQSIYVYTGFENNLFDDKIRLHYSYDTPKYGGAGNLSIQWIDSTLERILERLTQIGFIPMF